MARLPKNLLPELRRTSRQAAFRPVREEHALLTHAIKDNGFSLHGRGKYEQVFINARTAIKLIAKQGTRAYQAYARMCQRHHATNPLLPRVFHVLTMGRHLVVVMERLTHRSPKARNATLLASIVMESLVYGRAVWKTHLDLAAVYLRRGPSFLLDAMKKLRCLRKKFPSANWDLHEDNFMLRREKGVARVVLTDPILG